MSNVVTPLHLEEGARWTFVHRDGSTAEYVFDRMLQAPSFGLCATYALKNPATGKEAMVSERWLREGQISGGPHWVPKAEAEAMKSAA